MNLHDFLHFNRKCPICDEPLSLYMQWVNSVCFEAKQIDDKAYYFKPFKGLGKDPEGDSLKNEYMILEDNENVDLIMSNTKIEQESRKYQIYFFFVCNPAGFKDKGYKDYELNLFKTCYYRSSPFYEMRKDSTTDKWAMEHILPETKDVVVHDESLCFKHLGKDNERVYMLNLNYEKKETKIWHYIVPETEKDKKGYQPKLFSKTLPILTNRPDFGFDAREKLLDRFDSWIIMS